jgi:hypothetical protein
VCTYRRDPDISFLPNLDVDPGLLGPRKQRRRKNMDIVYQKSILLFSDLKSGLPGSSRRHKYPA